VPIYPVPSFAGRLVTRSGSGLRQGVVPVPFSRTPPAVTFVSQTKAKISRNSSQDASDVVFTADTDYQAYEVRVVSSSDATVTQGTLLESGSGGSNGSQRTITITDAELEAATGAEGSNLLKIFVQANSGIWST
jgi:hypothetical protein